MVVLAREGSPRSPTPCPPPLPCWPLSPCSSFAAVSVGNRIRGPTKGHSTSVESLWRSCPRRPLEAHLSCVVGQQSTGKQCGKVVRSGARLHAFPRQSFTTIRIWGSREGERRRPPDPVSSRLRRERLCPRNPRFGI